MPIDDPRRAALAFVADGSHCPITSLGRGNINDTYLVTSALRPFVLQRLNSRVFPQPLRVIKNFVVVSEQIQRAERVYGSKLRCAEVVPTRSGDLYWEDGCGGVWRGQSYLQYQLVSAVESAAQAWELGRVLATFHLYLKDLEPESLVDPLPGFHQLPGYLAEYDALDVNADRGSEIDHCHQAVARGRARALELEVARITGVLATRPIHGDPKIDNVIFDENGRACGLVDLDTVMFGLPHYDLGDCLRSSCNRRGEEAEGAKFDLDICRAVLCGYSDVAGSAIGKNEASYIFNGILAITFELALRFFTDHLRGDRYFKVGCHGDNLRRALRQFAMVEEVLVKEEEIRRIVAGTMP